VFGQFCDRLCLAETQRFSTLRFLLAVDQAVSILLKEKPKSKEKTSGSHAKSKVILAFARIDGEKPLQ
jgi:hypothetical protein